MRSEKEEIEAAEYFKAQGGRGAAIKQTIDTYNTFAYTLEHRNKLRAAQGHSYLKYDPFSGQGRILAVLAESDTMTQVQLARHLSVTPQTVSTAIRKLEREGLVQRTPDENDARVRHISLTAAGRTQKERLAAEERYSGSVFEALSEEELEQFMQLASKLTERLEQEIALSDLSEDKVESLKNTSGSPSLVAPRGVGSVS